MKQRKGVFAAWGWEVSACVAYGNAYCVYTSFTRLPAQRMHGRLKTWVHTFSPTLKKCFLSACISFHSKQTCTVDLFEKHPTEVKGLQSAWISPLHNNNWFGLHLTKLLSDWCALRGKHQFWSVQTFRRDIRRRGGGSTNCKPYIWHSPKQQSFKEEHACGKLSLQ